MPYEVVPPVKNGYAWWTIFDTTEKREMALISIDLPDAEKITREITERLNQASLPQNLPTTSDS